MDRITPLNDWILQTYGEPTGGASSRYLCGQEIMEIQYQGERQSHVVLGRIPEELSVVELDVPSPIHDPDDNTYIGPAAAIEEIHQLLGQSSLGEQL